MTVVLFLKNLVRVHLALSYSKHWKKPRKYPFELEKLELMCILIVNRKGGFFLLRASFRAFGPSFLSPVAPRVVLLLSTFAQPLLVTQMIGFVSDPGRTAEQGWALVGGFVCVYAIMTFSTSLYWEKVRRISCLHPIAV